MQEEIQSVMATLARAQLAISMTLARGAAAYLELTLKHCAGTAGELFEALQGPRAAGQSALDRAGAEMLNGYRQYLREVSALARIASLSVLDNMERLKETEKEQPADRAKAAMPPSPDSTPKTRRARPRRGSASVHHILY